MNKRDNKTMKNTIAVFIVGVFVVIILLNRIGFIQIGSTAISEATLAPTVSKEEAQYQQAKKLLNDGMFSDAADLFKEIGAYQDAMDQYYLSLYSLGNKYLQEGEYASARQNFEKISGYQDADAKVLECDYQKAVWYYKEKKYSAAAKLFESLGDYGKSKEYYEKSKKKVQEASEYFEVAYVVNDSDEEMNNSYYKQGDGKLVFSTLEPLDDWVGFGGKYVTYCRPLSTINFRLKNKGKKTLKNAVMKLEFEGVFLKEIYNMEFEGSDFIHGIGGCASASLQIGNLQAGTSKKYSFEMYEAYFEDGVTGKLRITLSADGYKAKKYVVPLELSNTY